jgi:hypothetical protein
MNEAPLVLGSGGIEHHLVPLAEVSVRPHDTGVRLGSYG